MKTEENVEIPRLIFLLEQIRQKLKRSCENFLLPRVTNTSDDRKVGIFAVGIPRVHTRTSLPLSEVEPPRRNYSYVYRVDGLERVRKSTARETNESAISNHSTAFYDATRRDAKFCP